MARYKNAAPTRSTHRARKNWVVIDVTKFLTLMAEGRVKGTLPQDHDGQCLFKLEYQVRVATAFGAYTERQARLYASNGGNWSSVEMLKKAGQRFSYKYFEGTRYAAVELRVLMFLREQPRISWDIAAMRREMYARYGDAILESLCTSFFPPTRTLAECKAEAARDQAELDRTAGKKPRPPIPTKPPKRRAYRIVDLEEFRNRRADALHAAEDNGTDPMSVHEGLLLKRATMTAVIPSSSWQRAVDRFRFRVTADRCHLPFGRFIAISEFEWSKAVELRELPALLTRDAIRKSLVAPPRAAKVPAVPLPWLRLWEAGCDDGQYGLPYYTLKQLLQFPLKRGKRQTPLIALTPAMRAWRPQRRRTKRAKQEQFAFPEGGIRPRPLRCVDRRRPNQYLLFPS
ncbi:hypothetical protein HY479_02275 [Candidatus Uhrbacteria bacterium]|nr:hypothetical protein [Candidatus Uhrbacteria bacterium]